MLAFYLQPGEFTAIPIVISLIFAGILGSILRYFLFDNKKASAFYGFAAGLVMSVLHMLILLLLHMDNLKIAYSSVHLLALPLMLSSAITAMLVLRLVFWASGEKLRDQKAKRGIAEIFQRWLLICVLVAFSITCIYTWLLQNAMAETGTNNLLRLTIRDVQANISETFDAEMLKITRKVAAQIRPEHYKSADSDKIFYNEALQKLRNEFDLTEINLIDRYGFNVASTNGNYCGYNMSNGQQSAEFLVLLDGTKELVQSYQAISSDASISRKYAGMALPSGGFVQIGYDAPHFQSILKEIVSNFTNHEHIGETGGVSIIDANGIIISDSEHDIGKTLHELGLEIPAKVTPGMRFQLPVHGQPAFCMYDKAEGYIILAYYPVEEALLYRNADAYSVAFMEIILFAVIFLLIYFLVKKLVVDNIHKINHELAKISNGNLDTRVDVHTNEEFTSLSKDINTTVDTLKRYIAEAAARIDQELEFARTIQLSILSTDFPAHPAFDIFASMDAAREIGGDFYDFYLLDKTKLVLLIADVSGKGIPAAMFMMRSKTLLKGLMENGLTPAEAFDHANATLAEHNDACMFVTAWMGVLDLATGQLDFVNAGHNPPLLGGTKETAYLHIKADCILGVIEDMSYTMHQLQLSPGDILFLYTDGLTEAMNTEEKLYGSDQPLAVLNQSLHASARDIVAAMKHDVEKHVGTAEQSDDLTMMVIRYQGMPTSEKTEPEPI